MTNIDPTIIANALSYPAYRRMIDELLEQSKTTGDNHSEAMLQYTRLNVSRMNRLDKTARLLPETLSALERIKRPIILLALTEAWCGDAAQSLPVLHKMAEASEQLTLRLILRDGHLDIMDAFLTNGGRSIPKVLFLDASNHEVLDTWGPRPAALQEMVTAGRKAQASLSSPEEKAAAYQALTIEAQKWYAKDKTRTVQREVMEAII